MASADPRIRQIKIKTGVVKRLTKEKAMYEKESIEQAAKVQKMEDEKKDEYDIRKQKEVLQESKQMIPDCEKRLRKAHSELTTMLENEKDLEETEEYKAAQTVLQEANIKD
ncbi:tubulin-specific chaperone A-like [Saccoglossus kowalevskii]|uniref:Tubulin-specific chaperone A n=1 Tax=Saccoglossus kowalevskii TaxID=10224 RepID=A0ABM0GJH2_SACKO|nr:PREDICTED: tubulin-specific chaperone A-like [Saccoglossus kowalevskii]